jgi:hypothetical protein
LGDFYEDLGGVQRRINNRKSYCFCVFGKEALKDWSGGGIDCFD